MRGRGQECFFDLFGVNGDSVNSVVPLHQANTVVVVVVVVVIVVAVSAAAAALVVILLTD